MFKHILKHVIMQKYFIKGNELKTSKVLRKINNAQKCFAIEMTHAYNYVSRLYKISNLYVLVFNLLIKKKHIQRFHLCIMIIYV